MASPSGNLTLTRHDNIMLLTLHRAPENRINKSFAQEIILALRSAESQLHASSRTAGGGALLTRGIDAKFFSTGIDEREAAADPHASADGFLPLLATLMDFSYPTVALVTGHCFGGAAQLALAHDYRVMNARRGWFCLPPVDLGYHFDGIGALPRLKLSPRVARKMLLEAHRWGGDEALADGVVDEVAEPEAMLEAGLAAARRVAPRGKAGVYALHRSELYGEAAEALRRISYVHGRATRRQGGGAKI
jgi:enoyl-CoA hydratase/carnithine racemase